MSIESKIPVFKNIDTDELKSIGESEKQSFPESDSISIEKEFETTNQHTKQTHEFNDNTSQTQEAGETRGTEKDFKNISGKNKLGKVLPGKVCLQLVDKIVPSLFVLILYYTGYEVEKKKLQLTKDEINELAPAVQDCLDTIEINFDNPWNTLAVMLGIVYGAKGIDAIPEIKKRQKNKKEARTLGEKLDQLAELDVVDLTPKEMFEKDYQLLAEEIRTNRGRGILDAKAYMAKMYPDKIKALGKKYNLNVTEQLNFTYRVPSQDIDYSKGAKKQREKKNREGEDFTLPE